MTRIISFVALVAILIVVGVLSFEVLSSFLLPMFIALLVVIMFRPLHERCEHLCRGRSRMAAALTTALILLIGLLPMLWMLARAGTESVSLVSMLQHEDLGHRLGRLRRHMGLELPPEELSSTITQMQTALDRFTDSLEKTVARDDPGERGLRKLWLKDLATWSKQLDPLVAAMLAPEPDERDKPSAAIKLPFMEPAQPDAVRASLADVQRSVDNVEQADGDASKSLDAAQAATASLARFKTQLVGGPVVAWLKSQLNLDKTQLDDLKAKLRDLVGPLALGTSTFLLDFMVGLLIMVMATYYFLADGPEMIGALMRLSPIGDQQVAQLLSEFAGISRAVILAMLLAAFLQGLLAGVGYFFVGLDSIFLLTVATMLCAMVPFVGATVIWGGCSLWLLVHDGRPEAAIGLAIYGIVVVSVADNVIKPMVLHGRSNLHPLLALLSVLGGAKALGAIGIVVGPMVVAFLQTLLVMLRRELTALDKLDGNGVPTAMASSITTTVVSPPQVATAALGSQA
jgi:predicted PurR-regulated permease PerM